MNSADSEADRLPREVPPGKVRWVCQRCTACCRWPGDVKVSAAEIAAMAGLLRVSEEEFIRRFTRLRTDRQGLSLIEKDDDSCIFLDGNECAVHEAKPQQCRDFPNKWNFPGWRQVCHAIPVPETGE